MKPEELVTHFSHSRFEVSPSPSRAYLSIRLIGMQEDVLLDKHEAELLLFAIEQSLSFVKEREVLA